MDQFPLPPAVADLVAARNRLRGHYAAVGLKFTIDGNLIGDLGEAIAAELFGIVLTPGRVVEGIDGHAADGRSAEAIEPVNEPFSQFRYFSAWRSADAPVFQAGRHRAGRATARER